MDSYNRTEYLTKIDQIRLRIQSKQTASKDTKSKYNQMQDLQNSVKENKIDPMKAIYELQKRRPLQSVQNKANQFQQRVKQLDSVSERIKLLLGSKRQTLPINENPPSFTNPIEKSIKNDKLTSLFQKEILFSQSKVAQIPRQRPLQSESYKNYSNQSQISEKNSDSSSNKTFAGKLESNSSNNESTSKFDPQPFKKQYIKDTVKDSIKHKYAEYNTNPITNNPPNNTSTQHKNYIPSSSLTVNTNPTTQITNLEKIEQNQKKRQQLVLKSTPQLSNYPQTKKLIETLCKQVQLQNKLKISKEKFDAFRLENKQTLLKDELLKRKVSLSEKQLDQWIKIEQQEFDPFVSIIFTKQFNFDQLIHNLVQAKNHWEQKVKKCVQIQQLNKEQFKIKQFQSYKRGSIYLQDFVCFINLKNDSCLKNRDLFSLFKHFMCIQSSKICGQHKIKYETFINYIGK